ncbi:hypothetical protein V8C37DRAFT_402187 [Trichoderma ceciliae]
MSLVVRAPGRWLPSSDGCLRVAHGDGHGLCAPGKWWNWGRKPSERQTLADPGRRTLGGEPWGVAASWPQLRESKSCTCTRTAWRKCLRRSGGIAVGFRVPFAVAKEGEKEEKEEEKEEDKEEDKAEKEDDEDDGEDDERGQPKRGPS